MKNEISLGKIAYYGNRKINEVTIDIELKDTKKGKVLSICGNIWNSEKTDILSCGQNLDEIYEFNKSPLSKEIHRLWKAYHLNDMHSGTKKQENAINEAIKNGTLEKYEYGKVYEYLKSINLYEDIVNGEIYEYGHGWLFEEIPSEDIEKINELMRYMK